MPPASSFPRHDQEKVINGDAATCLPKLPYSGLSRFGSSFLSKLRGVSGYIYS